MVKNAVQITIIEDSKGEKCEAQCGIDWSSPEAISLASHRLKDRFGPRVKLEYIGLAQNDATSYIREMKQQVVSRNLSLPLLLVNGQPRISGQFDIRMLLDVVEAEIEIEV